MKIYGMGNALNGISLITGKYWTDNCIKGATLLCKWESMSWMIVKLGHVEHNETWLKKAVVSQ